MWSHQSADVSLTVPFDAVHLILVLLVGCAEICCFGFICLQSISKRLLSLLPGRLLLLDLKDPTHTDTHGKLNTHKTKNNKESDTHVLPL